MAAFGDEKPKCPHCGHEASATYANCLFCGAPLDAPKKNVVAQASYAPESPLGNQVDISRQEEHVCPAVKCGKCGHRCAGRMARCIYCGEALHRSAPVQTRHCPRCQCQMEVKESTWVMIDRCNACRGEFYDPGEMERATKVDDKQRRWLEKHLAITEPDTADGQALTCPACNAAMHTFKVLGGRGCVIDRCPRCKGVWLDEGESERLRNIFDGISNDMPQIAQTDSYGTYTGSWETNDYTGMGVSILSDSFWEI